MCLCLSVCFGLCLFIFRPDSVCLILTKLIYPSIIFNLHFLVRACERNVPCTHKHTREHTREHHQHIRFVCTVHVPHQHLRNRAHAPPPLTRTPWPTPPLPPTSSPARSPWARPTPRGNTGSPGTASAPSPLSSFGLRLRMRQVPMVFPSHPLDHLRA